MKIVPQKLSSLDQLIKDSDQFPEPKILNFIDGFHSFLEKKIKIEKEGETIGDHIQSYLDSIGFFITERDILKERMEKALKIKIKSIRFKDGTYSIVGTQKDKQTTFWAIAKGKNFEYGVQGFSMGKL